MFVKFDERGNYESHSFVDNIDDIRPDPTGFEPCDIEVDTQDIWLLRKVNGVISIDETAKAKAIAEVEKHKRIAEIQTRLNALSQDIVQDLAGEVVPSIEERKAEFVSLHNELRGLKNMAPRELK